MVSERTRARFSRLTTQSGKDQHTSRLGYQSVVPESYFVDSSSVKRSS